VACEPDEHTRRTVLLAMRALLSDDHNHERGMAALDDLVDQILRDGGPVALRDVAASLTLALATALAGIAQDQGLTTEDLVEVWFAE
jgi:hypothetical protein